MSSGSVTNGVPRFNSSTDQTSSQLQTDKPGFQQKKLSLQTRESIKQLFSACQDDKERKIALDSIDCANSEGKELWEKIPKTALHLLPDTVISKLIPVFAEGTLSLENKRLNGTWLSGSKYPQLAKKAFQLATFEQAQFLLPDSTMPEDAIRCVPYTTFQKLIFSDICINTTKTLMDQHKSSINLLADYQIVSLLASPIFGAPSGRCRIQWLSQQGKPSRSELDGYPQRLQGWITEERLKSAVSSVFKIVDQVKKVNGYKVFWKQDIEKVKECAKYREFLFKIAGEDAEKLATIDYKDLQAQYPVILKSTLMEVMKGNLTDDIAINAIISYVI